MADHLRQVRNQNLVWEAWTQPFPTTQTPEQRVNDRNIPTSVVDGLPVFHVSDIPFNEEDAPIFPARPVDYPIDRWAGMSVDDCWMAVRNRVGQGLFPLEYWMTHEAPPLMTIRLVDGPIVPARSPARPMNYNPERWAVMTVRHRWETIINWIGNATPTDHLSLERWIYTPCPFV